MAFLKDMREVLLFLIVSCMLEAGSCLQHDPSCPHIVCVLFKFYLYLK